MKISIITVCLNAEKTIVDCLRSIALQTYKDYEHLVIDGGSTDRTVELVKQHSPKSKIYIGDDRGLYDAMNIGMIHSTGAIIGILNADDYFYDNDALSAVNNCFNRE